MAASKLSNKNRLLVEAAWAALEESCYAENNSACNCYLELVRPEDEKILQAIYAAREGDGVVKMEIICGTSDDPNGPANYVCKYHPEVRLADLQKEYVISVFDIEMVPYNCTLEVRRAADYEIPDSSRVEEIPRLNVGDVIYVPREKGGWRRILIRPNHWFLQLEVGN